MASVILCSELGRGTGHLTKLADYAVELEAQGYSVRLVTHDMHAAHLVPEFVDIAMFQAPRASEALAESLSVANLVSTNPMNFASVLKHNGYQSVSTLAPLVRGWLHLHATLKADVVVADHAPTAILAAKLLNIPSIMTGNGFCVPPLLNPLASICPWKDIPDSSLKLEDELLTHTINDTIRELGFSGVQLECAREAFSHAAQWIFSVPEMDHYGAREQPYVMRWYNSSPRLMPQWPYSKGEKIFLSMSVDSPYLNMVLEQLHLLQQPVLATVSGASDGLIERYKDSTIKLQRETVDLKQVVDECNIVINTGEHDVVFELLSYGVPSIILPSEPDQLMVAFQLMQQGLAFVGQESAEHLDISSMISMLKEQDQVWMNCSSLQMKYESHDSLYRLHDLIKAELVANG